MKNEKGLGMKSGEVKEGKVAKAIESKTKYLPSDLFLWSAIGSMGLSLGLQMSGKKAASQFVGQWAPTLLILGVYNKLVKVAGSDKVGGKEEFSDNAPDAIVAA